MWAHVSTPPPSLSAPAPGPARRRSTRSSPGRWRSPRPTASRPASPSPWRCARRSARTHRRPIWRRLSPGRPRSCPGHRARRWPGRGGTRPTQAGRPSGDRDLPATRTQPGGFRPRRDGSPGARALRPPAGRHGPPAAPPASEPPPGRLRARWRSAWPAAPGSAAPGVRPDPGLPGLDSAWPGSAAPGSAGPRLPPGPDPLLPGSADPARALGLGAHRTPTSPPTADGWLPPLRGGGSAAGRVGRCPARTAGRRPGRSTAAGCPRPGGQRGGPARSGAARDAPAPGGAAGRFAQTVVLVAAGCRRSSAARPRPGSRSEP